MRPSFAEGRTVSQPRSAGRGAPSEPPSATRILLPGALLFLFIPTVLFLYLRHPEPVAVSLALGFGLMIGHRFLARPYMFRVHDKKCLWSNKVLAPGEGVEVRIRHRGGEQEARCLERHLHDLERFFTHAYRRRHVLAVGIFVPLLLLLGGLLSLALGRQPWLPIETLRAIFQLSVGLTVNLAAWGYLRVRRSDETLLIRFPLHNFFLLGISNLLWIFRLVGTWWVVVAARYWLT